LRLGLLRLALRHLLRSWRAIPGGQAGLRVRRLTAAFTVDVRAFTMAHFAFDLAANAAVPSVVSLS
jgi:hypothetical protein